MKHANVRVRFKGFRHFAGEWLSIHRQRLPGGDAVLLRDRQNQRAEPAHLFLQHAARVGEEVGLEGVRADQFGEVSRAVDGRHLLRPHLVEGDAATTIGRRPGRLHPRKPAANNGYFIHG